MHILRVCHGSNLFREGDGRFIYVLLDDFDCNTLSRVTLVVKSRFCALIIGRSTLFYDLYSIKQSIYHTHHHQETLLQVVRRHQLVHFSFLQCLKQCHLFL